MPPKEPYLILIFLTLMIGTMIFLYYGAMPKRKDLIMPRWFSTFLQFLIWSCFAMVLHLWYIKLW